MVENKEMTAVDASQIVRGMLEREEISLRALHDEVGYSTSAWSDYLAGKYPGTVKNLDLAIVKFVRRRQQRESLFPIAAFTAIQKVLRMAFEFPELAVIFGDAGCGKTEGAKYYDQHHNHAVYIRCNPAMQAGELLDEVLTGLREANTGFKTLNRRISKIQWALQKSHRLIILDEAEHLPVRTLDMVRAIYDDGNCGLVLMGQDVLMEKLSKATLHENLNYFRSRIGLKYEIRRPTVKEIKAIIESRGITVTSDLIKEIDIWIKGEGELRKLDKILKRAKNICEWSDKKEIDDEALRAGYSLTMGG